MFLDHANPDTNFRLEGREKCDVLYPGSSLLHDHVGRFVLVELVGLQDAARLRLVPRQHQGHLAQDAQQGKHSYTKFQTVLRIRILDPGSGIGFSGSRIPDPKPIFLRA